MNRQTGSRNPFATQTGFSALSIESGEDTVEEEVVEEPTDRYPFLDAATRSITIYWMHLQYACDSQAVKICCQEGHATSTTREKAKAARGGAKTARGTSGLIP